MEVSEDEYQVRRPLTSHEAYLLIYGRAITAAGKRRRPTGSLRDEILARQNHLCLYCGLAFGAHVRRGDKVVSLKINWDHFVPYAYSYRNPNNNWVAACHVCNGIKSSRMFDTVIEAQEFIKVRWAEKGYGVVRPELDIEAPPTPAPAREASPPDEGPSEEVEKWKRRVLDRLKGQPPARRIRLLGNHPTVAGLAALEQLMDKGRVFQRVVDGVTLYALLKPKSHR